MSIWKYWKHWKKGLPIVASVSALTLVLVGYISGAAGIKKGHEITPNKKGNVKDGSIKKITNFSGPLDNLSNRSAQSKPVEGGSIVLDETRGPKHLDPALAYDTQSWEVIQQLNDELVTYKKGTNNTEIKGMDAKSWTISKDQKTYTFHLRNGLTFWNGQPVTAQNYIDEMERIATKKLGSDAQWLITNIVGEQAFYNGKAKTISGLSAPNKNTLVIKLTHPTPTELERLAEPFFSPIDPGFLKKVGHKAFDSSKVMGDGPFMLQSINSKQVVLVKNPHYWQKDQYGNQLPYLNKITINIDKNTGVDAANYEQGKTAWLGKQQQIPSSALPKFENTPKLKQSVQKVVQNAVYYVGLNNKMAPFNKKAVRQAMEYAINKQAIVQILNGQAVTANQPLPPNVPGYETNLPKSIQYNYEPTKAKQLLKQAGVTASKLHVTLYSQNSPHQMKIDKSIQSDLKAIGIDVTLKAMPWSKFLSVVRKGKAQMFFLNWVQDYPDASDFLMLFKSTQAPDNNSSMYKNTNVDKWLKQARDTSNSQQRIQLFHKVTNQIMQDAPWVPVYYPVRYYAVQKWIHGWYAPAYLRDAMQYVWISKGRNTAKNPF
ncbi:ABC transporter substrate-binding protein [Alicyclobacillus sp. SO9]|uniref:ABC transporter substrate-binding protein n=1 Tax=Alicyclobacillus sp. SO9 TaxID=2665646 RepID=UPI0018E81BB7|nr:ABC transporter substrate-binding protein [Alicyclobacillus sp. SO9]QQE79158.1 ABC transporter substrate-binding protein [Alicyclobacillus sp. SO9]